MIRKVLLLSLVLCTLMTNAGALTSGTFPDLGYLLDTPCMEGQRNYVFSQSFTCDVYTWDYPDNWPEKFDRLLPLLAVNEGWTYEEANVEGYPAYQLTGPKGEYALLVPRFGGQVLLLLPVGYEVISPGATPAPTLSPKPTGKTIVQPLIPSGGHYEWQNVSEDCPFCVGGSCKTCNGTGVYRLYGQAVDCDPHCSTCDGKGTITQRKYVFIPD